MSTKRPRNPVRIPKGIQLQVHNSIRKLQIEQMVREALRKPPIKIHRLAKLVDKAITNFKDELRHHMEGTWVELPTADQGAYPQLLGPDAGLAVEHLLAVIDDGLPDISVRRYPEVIVKILVHVLWWTTIENVANDLAIQQEIAKRKAEKAEPHSGESSPKTST